MLKANPFAALSRMGVKSSDDPIILATAFTQVHTSWEELFAILRGYRALGITTLDVDMDVTGYLYGKAFTAVQNHKSELEETAPNLEYLKSEARAYLKQRGVAK